MPIRVASMKRAKLTRREMSESIEGVGFYFEVLVGISKGRRRTIVNDTE